MVRYLIADTETTGASTDDKICELAYIEVDADLNELSRQHSLIDPQRRISASAAGVHGITEEMVQDAPTIEEFFSVVLDPPLDGEIILIAHKVAFDRRYLEPYLPPIVGQLCTLKLARRYLPDAENHKLSTLAYQYGLDKGDSHRADGDVRTAFSLLRFIVLLSGKTLPELVNEDKLPQLVSVMPFGKYRDVPMTQLDRGYAQWAIGPKGLTDIDPDLRYTLTLRAEGKL